MEKFTIDFEPFEVNGKEFLVPCSFWDFENLKNLLAEVGLEMLEMVLEPIRKDEISRRGRFQAVPLSVENLVALQEICKIGITQQTIDK